MAEMRMIEGLLSHPSFQDSFYSPSNNYVFFTTTIY